MSGWRMAVSASCNVRHRTFHASSVLSEQLAVLTWGFGFEADPEPRTFIAECCEARSTLVPPWYLGSRVWTKAYRGTEEGLTPGYDGTRGMVKQRRRDGAVQSRRVPDLISKCGGMLSTKQQNAAGSTLGLHQSPLSRREGRLREREVRFVFLTQIHAANTLQPPPSSASMLDRARGCMCGGIFARDAECSGWGDFASSTLSRGVDVCQESTRSRRMRTT
eukprot:93644-Rhodomonas_salina.1